MSNLPVLDAYAAFVDVGSEQMYVSIAGGPPKVFGTVTLQLEALREWLLSQQVRSVAMEATGVYWLPLYSVLEEAGLAVFMVNGRQTRNLPGRKTDMKDCQWGATLHAHGLLRAGFVPPAQIRRLQDYIRLRGGHIKAAASHVQHMQKALERMNIKLHDVISSLSGVSGLAVVRAILGGERDPHRLLMLCDTQIQRKQGRARQRSAPGDVGRRASVCTQASAAKLGTLSGSDCRVRPADRATAARRRWGRCPARADAPAQVTQGWCKCPGHPGTTRHPRPTVWWPRPDALARPHRVQRLTDRQRGRYRFAAVGDRKTFHGLDGVGPR